MSNHDIDRQAIMSRALRHGFTLREQPGGEMGLNDYVYAFAREVFEAGRLAGASESGRPTSPCQGHARQQEAEEAAAPTYSHLTSRDTFSGQFDTPEDAAAAYLIDNEDADSIEVGENKPRTAHHYVSAGRILEDVAAEAYDECGEVIKGWLDNLSLDKSAMAELEKLVGDWIQQKEPPNFWCVENVRTITRAELVASGHLSESASSPVDQLIGLRGCNSQHGGQQQAEPCIYRMRTTDPGCTGCTERDEDQSTEAGG